MDKPEKTAWFPAGVEPARDGVYEVKIKLLYGRGTYVVYYARWLYGIWRCTSMTPAGAATQKENSDQCYDPRFLGWRGLAADPAATVGAK